MTIRRSATCAAVLDALAPGEQAVLVGCSQGGRVALDAALADPALSCARLVLVAPAIGGAPEVDAFPPALERWFARMEHAEAAADVDAINALEAHAWLDGPLAPDGRVGGAVRDLFLAMNDIALRAEQRGTEIEPPPAWPRLHDVAAPALVVCGDLDFPHIVERCARLAAEMPASEAHTMHGAAHLPNLEQPAQFMHLLRRFLARLPAWTASLQGHHGQIGGDPCRRSRRWRRPARCGRAGARCRSRCIRTDRRDAVCTRPLSSRAGRMRSSATVSSRNWSPCARHSARRVTLAASRALRLSHRNQPPATTARNPASSHIVRAWLRSSTHDLPAHLTAGNLALCTFTYVLPAL